MSRFDFDYNFDYNDESLNEGRYALWQANLQRALKGKRGQKALRELREALLALPVKKLVAGSLCDLAADGEASFCAVGAFAFYKRQQAGESAEHAIQALAEADSGEEYELPTVEEGEACGLVHTLAWELAMRNDEIYGGLTPEGRYTRYLAWVDSQLAPASLGENQLPGALS